MSIASANGAIISFKKFDFYSSFRHNSNRWSKRPDISLLFEISLLTV